MTSGPVRKAAAKAGTRRPRRTAPPVDKAAESPTRGAASRGATLSKRASSGEQDALASGNSPAGTDQATSTDGGRTRPSRRQFAQRTRPLRSVPTGPAAGTGTASASAAAGTRAAAGTGPARASTAEVTTSDTAASTTATGTATPSAGTGRGGRGPAGGGGARHTAAAADHGGATTSDRPASGSTVAPGAEELLATAIGALRMAATTIGIPPEDVERRVAQWLAFLRRRLEGDFTVDDFGLDEDFAENVFFPMMRPLYRHWFRVEVRGVENLPRTGGALIVANHSGTVAIDSLMTQVGVHDEHPDHRYLRPLGADLVFQTPFLGTFARRSGATIAANPDAERLLREGELVGVWPEGFKGVGKPFKDRYKLQRFGRGGFVSAALRAGVPIVPTAIVGAEEIYPIVGDIKTLARLFGLPYFPVTANMALGPLGVLPLPSKWIIEFGRPVDTAALGPAAAEDPMLVFDLTDRVREQIQQSLYTLLMQRRSVFF